MTAEGAMQQRWEKHNALLAKLGLNLDYCRSLLLI